LGCQYDLRRATDKDWNQFAASPKRIVEMYGGRIWNFASFAAPHHFGRYWSRCGHRLVLGSEVSVAIDP
jgi:hypothetical protein